MAKAVWLVHTVTNTKATLDGVMEHMDEAADMLKAKANRTAVLFEVGKDYTDVHKFTIMTSDNPVPREVDFGIGTPAALH